MEDNMITLCLESNIKYQELSDGKILFEFENATITPEDFAKRLNLNIQTPVPSKPKITLVYQDPQE